MEDVGSRYREESLEGVCGINTWKHHIVTLGEITI